MKRWLANNWHWLFIIAVGVALWYSDKRSEQRVTELLIEARETDKKVETLEGEKNTLKAQVQGLEAKEQDLLQQVEQGHAEIGRIMAELEKSRASTLSIRYHDELLTAFMTRFPAFDAAGLMEIHDPQADIAITHMVAPAGLLDQMVDYHDRVEADLKLLAEYRANEEKYGGIIELNHEKTELQARVNQLNDDIISTENAARVECTKDLVTEIRKPRVDLGGWGGFKGGLAMGAVGGGVLGFLACDQIGLTFNVRK